MIVSVQYLRGIAALMVVYAHVSTQVIRYSGVDLPLYKFGHFGVDVFFVISGFIMWQTTFNKKLTPWTFFYRRLTRIAPTYWLFTSIVVFVAVFAPNALTSTRFESSHVLTSYLFIPHQHPVLTEYYFPVLIVGWTLNYEMFFYLVFSLSLNVAQYMRMAAIVGAFGCIALCGALFHLTGIARFYTNSIILEFSFGVIVGYVITHRQFLSPMQAMVISVVIFVAAKYFEYPRLLAFGLPALFLVYALTSYEKENGGFIKIRTLKLLGDASYSLYLTHALTIAVIAKGWAYSGWEWGTPQIALFVGLAMLGSSLMGIAAYYCIEDPICSFFKVQYVTKKKSRFDNIKV